MDTKKLRQKILDLAIHGKLVPQDPNDEPASVLLERIRAEKERLIKEGKIKRGKKSASDTSHYENVPFEVPESWEWTTIGEIASSILYGVITDIQNNKVNWETVPFTDYDNNKAQAYLLNDGDILFARTGATVGKSYLVEGLRDSAIYASYLIRVQTSSVILPAYIKFFFESGFYWEQISLNSVGIGQPNVNGTTLAALAIPIPPYREQLRIVEEAKKWLSVIDGLDVEIDDLQTYITQVKSRILNLAIHGKLVPQDPNDEPAIELLKRINPKFVPCDNAHYENVPEGWCTICVGDLAEYTNGKAFKPSDWERNGLPIIRIQNLNDENCQYNYTSITHEEKYRISHGDLLFAWAASLGVYIWQGNKAWLNQHIFKVDPHPFIDKQYLYYIFEYLVSEFYTRSHGSGMVHITKKEFETTIALLPPLSEQRRIVKSIESYYTTLDNISANL